MHTLLSIYKWQVALAAALLYIVWPYVSTLVNWMSANTAARELVLDAFITFALTAALAYVLYTIWNDQRPKVSSRKAST
jgi:hypothetical protein